MKINKQGVKDNLTHLAGIVVGLTYLKLTGKRYSKQERGTKPFCTISANIAASEYVKLKFLPYRMILK